MRSFLQSWMMLAFLFAAACLPGAERPQVDPELPAYEPVTGIAGKLDATGSDTLNNLMTLWAEAFQAIYPNVRIQIEGKGSSTAPPALIEGTAQIVPMSREMKSTEVDAFEERFSYKPYQVPVALDAVAIYVHKDNPVSGLTVRQLDGIFSGTFRRGGPPLETWGDLGINDNWSNRRISIYGRNSASGTYGFFKEMVLAKGDFRSSVKEQPGSSAVVQGISRDVYGIGYSGIGYRTSGIKVLALAQDNEHYFRPTLENCLSGDYPLARLLYIYLNRHPLEQPESLVMEFLKFILSQQGQAIAVKDGYFPLPAEFARQVIEDLEK